jgi:hypothetical protein
MFSSLVAAVVLAKTLALAALAAVRTMPNEWQHHLHLR